MHSPLVNTDHDGRNLERELLRLRPKMRRFASSLCYRFKLAEHLVQDIVQSAMLGVWQNYDPAVSYPHFETWVMTVIKNTALNHVRKGRKYVETDDINALIDVKSAYVMGEASDLYIDANLLHEAIEKLSQVQREALDAVYFKEQSSMEAAVQLQIPPETVRTRLYYARKRLAALLEAHA